MLAGVFLGCSSARYLVRFVSLWLCHMAVIFGMGKARSGHSIGAGTTGYQPRGRQSARTSASESQEAVHSLTVTGVPFGSRSACHVLATRVGPICKLAPYRQAHTSMLISSCTEENYWMCGRAPMQALARNFRMGSHNELFRRIHSFRTI